MLTLLGSHQDITSDVANLLPPMLPLSMFSRRSRVLTVEPHASALDGPSSSGASSGAAGSTQASSSASSGGSSQPDRPLFRLPGGFGGLGAGMGIGAGLNLGSAGSAKALGFWPFGSRNQASQPEAKRSVLIMMSDTGGGHRASAEAIKAAFLEEYGDKYQFFIVDMLKHHTPAPFNAMPDTYSFLVANSILWRMAYEITNPRAFHIPNLATIGSFMYKQISEALDLYQPDLVVSVHPLMQHVPIRVIRDRVRSSPTSPPATTPGSAQRPRACLCPLNSA